jgi:hypothetical protein
MCVDSDGPLLTMAVERGTTIQVQLTVKNEAHTNSPPLTVLAATLQPPWLPTFFGNAACTSCSPKSLTAGYALSWPGLAAGATKELSFGLTASGAPGNYQWFVALYAAPADQVAAGPIDLSGALLSRKAILSIVAM